MFDKTSHSCGIVVHARIALFIEVYPAVVVGSGVRPAVGRWIVVVVTFVVPMRCLTVVSGHDARGPGLSMFSSTVRASSAGVYACALPAVRP